jgi:hypothetical protein
MCRGVEFRRGVCPSCLYHTELIPVNAKSACLVSRAAEAFASVAKTCRCFSRDNYDFPFVTPTINCSAYRNRLLGLHVPGDLCCASASIWLEGRALLLTMLLLSHLPSQLSLSALYPQDSNAVPCLSDSGQYAFRIFFNGEYRRVSE